MALALTLPAAASARQPAPDVERDVRAFARSFQDAIDRKDRLQLERVIAREFTSIDRAGTVRTREQWIAAVVSGAMLAQKSEPEEFADELTVFGPTVPAGSSCMRSRGTRTAG